MSAQSKIGYLGGKKEFYWISHLCQKRSVKFEEGCTYYELRHNLKWRRGSDLLHKEKEKDTVSQTVMMLKNKQDTEQHYICPIKKAFFQLESPVLKKAAFAMPPVFQHSW